MIQSIVRTILVAALLVAAMSVPVRAAGNDLVLDPGILQTEFDNLAEEVSLVVAYNPLAPTAPEGLLGFDLGLSVSTINIDSALWNLAVSDGAAPSSLIVPRLHARKGLPFGIDVAVSYVSVPTTNIAVLGGEIRKSIINGGMLSPSVGLTVHGSKLSGVSSLDVSTYGVGLGVSKGFVLVTPYAGIDQVFYKMSENLGLGRTEADDSFTRYHVGAKFSLGLLKLTGQADFGPATTYSMKVSVGL